MGCLRGKSNKHCGLLGSAVSNLFDIQPFQMKKCSFATPNHKMDLPLSWTQFNQRGISFSFSLLHLNNLTIILELSELDLEGPDPILGAQKHRFTYHGVTENLKTFIKLWLFCTAVDGNDYMAHSAS